MFRNFFSRKVAIKSSPHWRRSVHCAFLLGNCFQLLRQVEPAPLQTASSASLVMAARVKARDDPAHQENHQHISRAAVRSSHHSSGEGTTNWLLPLSSSSVLMDPQDDDCCPSTETNNIMRRLSNSLLFHLRALKHPILATFWLHCLSIVAA